MRISFWNSLLAIECSSETKGSPSYDLRSLWWLDAEELARIVQPLWPDQVSQN